MAFILNACPVESEFRGGLEYYTHLITRQIMPNRVVEASNITQLESELDSYIEECRKEFTGLFCARVTPMRGQRKPRGFDNARAEGVLVKMCKPD